MVFMTLILKFYFRYEIDLQSMGYKFCIQIILGADNDVALHIIHIGNLRKYIQGLWIGKGIATLSET